MTKSPSEPHPCDRPRPMSRYTTRWVRKGFGPDLTTGRCVSHFHPDSQLGYNPSFPVKVRGRGG